MLSNKIFTLVSKRLVARPFPPVKEMLSDWKTQMLKLITKPMRPMIAVDKTKRRVLL